MSFRELIVLIQSLHEEMAVLPHDPYMPGNRRETIKATLDKAVKVTRERKKVSATTAAKV